MDEFVCICRLSVQLNRDVNSSNEALLQNMYFNNLAFPKRLLLANKDTNKILGGEIFFAGRVYSLRYLSVIIVFCDNLPCRSLLNFDASKYLLS